MRALVSAASAFDFRIARSTPSQQFLAAAILDVGHHLLLQFWAKRPSSRVRSLVSRGTEDSASFHCTTAHGKNVSDLTVFCMTRLCRARAAATLQLNLSRLALP